MKIKTEFDNLFLNLRSDKSPKRWSNDTRFRAPHKVFLLLAVLDLYDENKHRENFIELDQELSYLFQTYWSSTMSSFARGNILLPFFHLRSDGFWFLISKLGKEEILKAMRQIKTLAQFSNLVLGAKLDDELHKLLKKKEIRQHFRSLLIFSYFSEGIQVRLINQTRINLDSHNYSEQLLALEMKQTKTEAKFSNEGVEKEVRGQGFRRAITFAYNHRCCLCGLRILTVEGHTVVDASHIVPWSLSQNDRPENGLALCKLCHWIFDKGLVHISIDYLIIVSQYLTAFQNLPNHVLTLTHRKLFLPEVSQFHPDKNALLWHKKNIYKNI